MNKQKIYFLRKMIILLVVMIFVNHNQLLAQCCSGGGGGAGSLAGNFAQGVLTKNQIQLNLNSQHIHTERFMYKNESVKTTDYLKIPGNYLKGFDYNYLYSRFAYGVNDKLTLSIETGYYFNKTEYKESYLVDTINSSGISDLVIFPRYNVFSSKTKNQRTDITIGLGLKIPIGSYSDSVLVYSDETLGVQYYDMKSPAVQTSSGSNDFMYFGSISRKFIPLKFSLLLSSLYIQKGWSPLGEKFGNYFATSLFFSKKITSKLGSVVQFKGEIIGEKKRQQGLGSPISASDLAENSGSSKLFVAPRLVYNQNSKLSFYAFMELPVYQYVHGTQLASTTNFSIGIFIQSASKEH